MTDSEACDATVSKFFAQSLELTEGEILGQGSPAWIQTSNESQTD